MKSDATLAPAGVGRIAERTSDDGRPVGRHRDCRTRGQRLANQAAADRRAVTRQRSRTCGIFEYLPSGRECGPRGHGDERAGGVPMAASNEVEAKPKGSTSC